MRKIEAVTLRLASAALVVRVLCDILSKGTVKRALPDEDAPGIPPTIDNTGPEINDKIQSLVGQADVTFAVVLASSLDLIEAGPFRMQLPDARTTTRTIIGMWRQESDTCSQQALGPQYSPAWISAFARDHSGVGWPHVGLPQGDKGRGPNAWGCWGGMRMALVDMFDIAVPSHIDAGLVSSDHASVAMADAKPTKQDDNGSVTPKLATC